MSEDFSISDVTVDQFLAHVDSVFSLQDGTELKLCEVKELPSHGPEFRTPFSLLFHGQFEQTPGGGIYPLHHVDLGDFELHLSPIIHRPSDPPTNPPTVYLEAVFA